MWRSSSSIAAYRGRSVPATRLLHACLGSVKLGSRATLQDSLHSQTARRAIFTRTYSANHGPTAGYPGISISIEERTPNNSIATIQISHPTKMNIVNTSILTQLIKSCHNLSQEENLRAVILTGSPTSPGKSPSFIGGADIKEMSQLSSSTEARTFITNIHSACSALRNLPVPVIARVNGWCLGAGLEIMASCDLRIATASSVFAMPEVRVGIPSVVEAALLPSQIGMGRTKRLLYLAENISATEAESWGLIEKVVDDEKDLDQVVGEWTDRLCEMGPKAIRNQKRLIRKWEGFAGVEQGIEAGVEAFGEAFEDGGMEPREFMGRFLGRSRK